MSWLSGLFFRALTFTLEKLVMSWLSVLAEKYKDYLKKKQQEKIDLANAEKYKSAINEGKSDEEISQAAQDFLNGKRP